MSKYKPPIAVCDACNYRGSIKGLREHNKTTLHAIEVTRRDINALLTILEMRLGKTE